MTKDFVSQLNVAKGYGLIEPIAGGGQVFIHHLVLEVSRIGGLKDRQNITSNIETDGNGNQYVANLMLA